MQKLSSKKYDSIPFSVMIFLAWKNIATKKLRSAITVLGVVIGIGSIFFLLSLGLGLQNLVTNEIIGNQSVKSINISSPNSKIVSLNSENVDRIGNLSNVENIGVSYSFASSLKFNGSEIDTITYGIDKPYQDLSDFNIIYGELFSKDAVQDAYLNKAALEAVGLTEDLEQVVGQKIDLVIPIKSDADETEISQSFKIVGVIDSGAGSEIFIPSVVFEQEGVEVYDQAKLIVSDADGIDDTRKQIESLGFETTSPIDTIDQINQIFRYFNIILVGFGAIGMIVAVLGMFNTLTISLLERTREIGLMVALGGRHKDMRRLFILESILLSVIGSIIGIILAVIAGGIINTVMNQFASGRGVTEGFDIFATPWWLVSGLIIFMALVGLAVVFLPARRAQHINPIDALRRE
ncbi:ABC transporter permease [Candidatus Saccharibacteria bacterium]|nr:ABC transporter permease [Candidatus Saccharibacteria bacterium]